MSSSFWLNPRQRSHAIAQEFLDAVRIGRSLRSFPLPNAACEFPRTALSSTRRDLFWVLAFEVEDLGHPSEAHQFEHGTTRRVTTPTLLENKMSLLKPSSAFLTHIPCSSRQASFPGKPSPCLPHYRRALGYYVASALCPACWHSRTPSGSSGVRVPQFQDKM